MKQAGAERRPRECRLAREGRRGSSALTESMRVCQTTKGESAGERPGGRHARAVTGVGVTAMWASRAAAAAAAAMVARQVARVGGASSVSGAVSFITSSPPFNSGAHVTIATLVSSPGPYTSRMLAMPDGRLTIGSGGFGRTRRRTGGKGLG